MIRWIVGALTLIGLLVVSGGPSVHAESIRITPLQYQAELKKGERKKGSVDISNPTTETVALKLYVNGFSQVDSKGNLTFFDDEQIKKGLLLDYDSVTLEPRQTLRLFFIADGTKLPPGDVFGVIFAETIPADNPGTSTAVRVGTLVMLTNGTPGPRTAEISDVAIPFFQTGDVFSGEVSVKNPAEKGSATGFFPEMTVEIAPWGGRSEFKGPLIFASHTRTFSFEKSSNQFGIYTVKIRANNAEKTVSVFLMTGWWRILVPVILVCLVSMVVVGIKFRPWRRLLKRRS